MWRHGPTESCQRKVEMRNMRSCSLAPRGDAPSCPSGGRRPPRSGALNPMPPSPSPPPPFFQAQPTTPPCLAHRPPPRRCSPPQPFRRTQPAATLAQPQPALSPIRRSPTRPRPAHRRPSGATRRHPRPEPLAAAHSGAPSACTVHTLGAVGPIAAVFKGASGLYRSKGSK